MVRLLSAGRVALPAYSASRILSWRHFGTVSVSAPQLVVGPVPAGCWLSRVGCQLADASTASGTGVPGGGGQQLVHRGFAEVVPPDQPLVVLLGEQSPQQAEHRRPIREDPDHRAAPLEFFVQPLQGVRAVDL